MKARNIVAALSLGVAVSLASCATLPPWKSVPTGQSVAYGRIQDSRRAVTFTAYADDPGIITISVENGFGGFSPRYGLVVDQPARDSLRDIMKKYDEWAKLATDNNVEVTREINTVTLPQMFNRGRGWEGEGERQVTFVFTSRTSPDKTHVTLTMRSSSLFYGTDLVVLSDDQASDFSRYLQDGEVEAGYQQAKKKQETLDMFK